MKTIGMISHGALIVALAGIASAAQAQDTTTSPAAASANVDAGDAIIVTGTRTTGLRAADSAAPIQVLGNDVLKRTGQPDLIQALAQNLPSIQAEAFGSDQSAFHLSFKLRGLNPNHTLVLLNGKRRHGTASVVVSGGAFSGNAAADVSLIPVDSIDHVEVLQDGAAAQYGTDAIAGVINIIQKKSSSGGDLNVTGGKYIDQGGKTYDVMGNIGIEPFDGAYLNVTAERKHHGYSFRGDVDPRVVSGNATGNANLARFPNLVNAANYPYVNQILGDGRYDLTSGTFNAGYVFSPDVELYTFGSYAHKNGSAYENYRLPTVVVGVAATDIPFPLGFAPREVTRETDYAFTGGLKGNFMDTTWDVSSTYGRDLHEVYVEDSANQTLYRNSSTATTTGVTPREFHDGDFIASQWTNTLDLTHQFDLGLAEPLTLAGGIEYRHETYAIRAGDPTSYFGTGAQSFFGYSPVNASKNSRNDFSQYLDVSVKPIDSLLIDGAVRHEHYSDFGSTTVFKLTSRFDLSPAIAIRGTASTGFRAPTLAEAFYSGINVGPNSVSGVFAPNSPGAAFLGIGGLKPEKSTNFSGGLVLHPVRRLTLTVDAYTIKIRDRIVQTGTLYGYNSNKTIVTSPSVLQALTANGVALDPAIFTASSGSVGVQTFVNGISTRTKGIDLVATYASDLGSLGHVDWSLTGNYNKTKITKIAPPPSNINQSILLLDAIAQSNITKTTPKFRVTAGAFWTIGDFSLNLRESFYSSSYALANYATLPGFAVLKVNRKFITDAELAYHVIKPLKLSIGANNLFNVYPTKSPAVYRQDQFNNGSNAYVTQYPTFSPIGINGGYYYARATFSF